MVDRTKIGARVPEPVYNDFKNMVQSVHGQTRGVLGDEIGNALRAYMEGDFEGSAESDVSNEDLLREIRELKTGESPASPRPGSSESEGTHTHTAGDGSKSEPTVSDGGASGDVPEPSESEGSVNVPDSTDKPKDRASQRAKIDWIVGHTELEGRVPFAAVKHEVKEHFRYREDTVEDLAWGVASMMSPAEDKLPDDVPSPNQKEGAWVKLDTDKEIRDQTLMVYLGDDGLDVWVGHFREEFTEESTDGESEEESTDSDGESSGSESSGPTYGSSVFGDESGESSGSRSEEESTDNGSEEGDIAGEEEGDSTFGEMADADRGRDY